MIYREMIHFVHMRHLFLISKSHSRLPQARTVLITNVPDDLADEHSLRQFASFVPGGIERIWFYRDTKELNHLFSERQDACAKLEKAASQLLRIATLEHRKRERAQRKANKKGKRAVREPERDLESKGSNATEAPLVPTSASTELMQDLVPATKRPMHKLGLMGCIGEKVDTIEHCKVSFPFSVVFSFLKASTTGPNCRAEPED
jgi:calcium permeable stress-gated cation channel